MDIENMIWNCGLLHQVPCRTSGGSQVWVQWIDHAHRCLHSFFLPCGNLKYFWILMYLLISCIHVFQSSNWKCYLIDRKKKHQVPVKGTMEMQNSMGAGIQWQSTRNKEKHLCKHIIFSLQADCSQDTQSWGGEQKTEGMFWLAFLCFIVFGRGITFLPLLKVYSTSFWKSGICIWLLLGYFIIRNL